MKIRFLIQIERLHNEKYHVKGSYLQWFECFVEADSLEEAEEIALSGDADYMPMDCDDWSIEYTKQVIK